MAITPQPLQRQIQHQLFAAPSLVAVAQQVDSGVLVAQVDSGVLVAQVDLLAVAPVALVVVLPEIFLRSLVTP
jgi:hypothetical protein